MLHVIDTANQKALENLRIKYIPGNATTKKAGVNILISQNQERRV